MPRDKRQTIADIERLRGEGYTLDAVAQKIGLSRWYIAEICWKFGIKRGGKIKRKDSVYCYCADESDLPSWMAEGLRPKES